MSLETIKTVEDLSLNAWPSHQMQVYDGWILRFSYFYTHRTNCVETIGPAQLPLPEKVAYCEEVYEKWRTACVFKISPLTTPALELYLADGATRSSTGWTTWSSTLPPLAMHPSRTPPSRSSRETGWTTSGWKASLN